jgi:GNAT superfamily N-acetyltransferase
MLVGTGVPAEWARPSFPPELVDDPDTAMFIPRLDGRPVGTAFATRTRDVCGIYAVGTLEAARRRGAGTAATWACVGAAQEWGCRAVVLQASEMGYPVYRRMGFEPVVDYARFLPRQAA